MYKSSPNRSRTANHIDAHRDSWAQPHETSLSGHNPHAPTAAVRDRPDEGFVHDARPRDCTDCADLVYKPFICWDVLMQLLLDGFAATAQAETELVRVACAIRI